MSKSRGNAVEPWEVIDALRGRRLPLVLLHRQAALGRLPLLRRGDRRAGAPVPASRCGTPTTSTSSTRTPTRGLAPRGAGRRAAPARRPRPLGALAHRRHRQLVAERLDAYDATAAGRAIAELRRRPLELVRAPLAPALLGRRPGGLRTLRSCLLTIAKLLAPFCPFVADEIYDNLDGALASVHLCDFPRRRALPARDRDWRRRWRSRARRSRLGLGARGQGEDQGAPAAARGGGRRRRAPSARRSSGSRTSCATS